MRRTASDDDLVAFRATIRAFIDAEVVPSFGRWYRDGLVPREFYYRLGDLGVFGLEVPVEFGGSGHNSLAYRGVLAEEIARAAVSFGGASAHLARCLPLITALATPAQQARWLPGVVTGDTMFALAVSEPGTGSEPEGMRTTAPQTAEGTYVLNGSKTYVIGGVHADRVIVCARTAPPRPDDPAFGLSLLVVDASAAGFRVGRRLDTLGRKVSGTAELTFTDVRVPAADLLGDPHRAAAHLAVQLPQQRLGIAVGAYARAKAAIRFTRNHTRDGVPITRPVAAVQHTKFELAGCRAEVDAIEAVVDRALSAHDRDELDPAHAASAELFATETAGRVIDRCLQLHGGAGYLTDSPIARLYADHRVDRLQGGDSDTLRTLIAADMGL
ncbi:acyl-CoA dehydrogenase family protein [Nocardia caishijiensis]|uniref:Alkylation response protein AidB-like acyl-CoA dehydrogenase n=1 Tax=Nocardia caishijiensis TaxID=184756 RepID=A0ABQ6YHP7_9NOCA|nr:acyl-CoA dehydrogenase family protein [Nocardia caishijiensis]KAF0845029.1 alkylation response protein AidB-like acyl-CoA dehydrogenase [Nocardia caishijiensis]